ncbi:hypothetical protein DICPUDRAFT_98818 [Dictyostelium purpureum]|uniref:Uncharacterized protein n=1 Tax=Dictyostelium purpureum TaxID=5786 RepID=F0ZTR9_DICPU|nr:uncharacterized protein DICPUDRAFT_98818 [Dictyostelium purpureum]EGC32642.1 hypothetical protein DICPUDRAFT_98818 [Dictyostelium purpureum]|eukprot:XP_003290811.1 hypothetical protein DICPUDRAFT_98818 [Dictyostelium purpureum]
MVSKVENKNNYKDYKDFSDESDGDNDDNGYSGFNLIPDDFRDESDNESVYSENNNNIGFEIRPAGDTYEEYIKNNPDQEDEEDEEEDNDFGDFVDFKNHSEQFHSLDTFDNSSSNNNNNNDDNDIEAKLKANPMLRGVDFSEYFPKTENDPFATNNDDLAPTNPSSDNKYSERNDKGHMVLERNKLFPPDHVAMIQECMKNIKLDYKPMWTNFIAEDKWMGALKNKLDPSTQTAPTSTSASASASASTPTSTPTPTPTTDNSNVNKN